MPRDGGQPPTETGRSETQDIAVIGAGISGLSCAWLLSQRHRVTLYEARDQLGGHCVTVDAGVPVDMGFIVYNEATYPNLTALFDHLRVPTRESSMSFAVSLEGGAFEYGGGTLRQLLAQPSNLLRPRFHSMLRDLARLYRMAARDGADLEQEPGTLGEFLDRHGFGAPLQEDHLLPMAACIWSAPPAAMRDYPAASFFRFCRNHGLLQLADRPVWRTVQGGSREYVRRLGERFAGRVLAAHPVETVRRCGQDVLVTARAETRRYDQVVLATHADAALAVLADATCAERAVLGRFSTSASEAVLHTDARVMPQRRAAWSSWNFAGARGDAGALPCVTYWMNQLQGLPGRDLFVTLNPAREPAPGTVLHRETFRHPLFDAAALAAQRAVWPVQGQDRVWFCGAWCGSGFHEDGLQAGLAVAESLGDVRRPWRVAAQSARIALPAAA